MADPDEIAPRNAGLRQNQRPTCPNFRLSKSTLYDYDAEASCIP
jgi:hypothetical protein